MEINGTLIEDTFSEAFTGRCVRATITARDMETVRRAALDATATPGAVIGRVEGGVESFLGGEDTPDGRPGAVVQFYYALDDMEKFQVELSYRIRQDILVKPFTALYSSTPDPDGYLDMMKHVGHCGDGYEWVEEFNGREMINVPVAVPDFKIESRMGYREAIMGANFWYMCRDPETVLEAGRAAIRAIEEVEGVVTPFDICSAASKPETNYPWIGPTTNHPYCPSLKEVLGDESRVPEGVGYIPEIVINGLTMEALEEAMRAGIEAVCRYDGVLRVSAGNYDGKLGDHRIDLHGVLG